MRNMRIIRSALKHILGWNKPWSKNQLTNYLRLVLFINPLLSFVFMMLIGSTDHFWIDWLCTNVVSDACTSAAFALIGMVITLEHFLYPLFGKDPPEHGRPWRILISALSILPGMGVGFFLSRKLSLALGHPWDAPNLQDYRIGMFYGIAIMTISILLETRREAREAHRTAEMKSIQLEKQKLQAQLTALTAQMSPHLLFNTLNTIASLIPQSPAVAEEITIQLSELFRFVLEASRNEKHSLSDELNLCHAYLSIEKSRFGNRLKSQVEIHPEMDPSQIQVPALLLQPLVENAVKYAVSTRMSGGLVTIRAFHEMDLIHLLVEDDGPGFGASPVESGAGSAIENCRSRLQLQYGDRASFEIQNRKGGGTAVALRLPINERSLT